MDATCTGHSIPLDDRNQTMSDRIEDLRQRLEEALETGEECLALIKECEEVMWEEGESAEQKLQVVYWMLLDAHPGYGEMLEEMDP